MNVKQKLAFLCYLLNALACFLLGLAFVFGTEFFPFHSDVIQTSWSDVDASAQTLYLGMMRTEGAGFLATGLALLILLLIPFRRGETWSYWAMSAIGIAEWFPSFLANLHVANTTHASPPWQGVLLAIFLLIIGLFASVLGSRASSKG